MIWLLFMAAAAIMLLVLSRYRHRKPWKRPIKQILLPPSGVDQDPSNPFNTSGIVPIDSAEDDQPAAV